MDPGPILYIAYNLLQLCFTVFFANIFHSIRLILCYSKPVRLTTSLFRWGKVLWFCCAGSTLAPESLVLRRITFRDHQPSTCFLTPTGPIKPWFLTEGNLPLCASYLPLGVPNGRVHLRASSKFLAPLPGRSRHAAKGVSHIQSLYFVFVLFYLLLCLLLYQNKKKLIASFTLFTVLFSILKKQKN